MTKNMSMVVASGMTVTQAHVDYCAENGHATWIVDGQDKGICPRCGAVTEVEDDSETFDRILDLEQAVRGARAGLIFAPAGTSDYGYQRLAESLASDRAKLSAAVDALTPEQMVRFGQYRLHG